MIHMASKDQQADGMTFMMPRDEPQGFRTTWIKVKTIKTKGIHKISEDLHSVRFWFYLLLFK